MSVTCTSFDDDNEVVCFSASASIECKVLSGDKHLKTALSSQLSHQVQPEAVRCFI